MPPNISAEDIERDLQFSILAAKGAGERLVSLRSSGRWEGKMLADVGDNAADGFLQGFIKGRYPDDGILSEETKDSEDRLSKSRVWIVDPLDGTKEFSQGRDDWAVHVALTIDGQCALGAVALPSQGRILWGVCLEGHERAGLEGPGEILNGSTGAPTPPRIAVSRSHTPEWVENFRTAMDGELARAGSVGNKVCMLLLGEADIYVHQIGIKEWDTCAPEVVSRSLGWTVCKLRGEEHQYNRPDPKNHELVICRPGWRERVLEAIQECGALDS